MTFMFCLLGESIFSFVLFKKLRSSEQTCEVYFHFTPRNRIQIYQVEEQKTDTEHWGKTDEDLQH